MLLEPRRHVSGGNYPLWVLMALADYRDVGSLFTDESVVECSVLALCTHASAPSVIEGIAWSQHTISVLWHVAGNVRMACRRHGSVQHQLHPLGAPKFWYAMPQARANALEQTMRGMRYLSQYSRMKISPMCRSVPGRGQELFSIPAA